MSLNKSIYGFSSDSEEGGQAAPSPPPKRTSKKRLYSQREDGSYLEEEPGGSPDHKKLTSPHATIADKGSKIVSRRSAHTGKGKRGRGANTPTGGSAGGGDGSKSFLLFQSAGKDTPKSILSKKRRRNPATEESSSSDEASKSPPPPNQRAGKSATTIVNKESGRAATTYGKKNPSKGASEAGSSSYIRRKKQTVCYKEPSSLEELDDFEDDFSPVKSPKRGKKAHKEPPKIGTRKQQPATRKTPPREDMASNDASPDFTEESPSVRDKSRQDSGFGRSHGDQESLREAEKDTTASFKTLSSMGKDSTTPVKFLSAPPPNPQSTSESDKENMEPVKITLPQGPKATSTPKTGEPPLDNEMSYQTTRYHRSPLRSGQRVHFAPNPSLPRAPLQDLTASTSAPSAVPETSSEACSSSGAYFNASSATSDPNCVCASLRAFIDDAVQASFQKCLKAMYNGFPNGAQDGPNMGQNTQMPPM